MAGRQIVWAMTAMVLTGMLYLFTLQQPSVRTIPASAEQTVQSAELPAAAVYWVQLGSYDTAELARIAAGRDVRRGSAGVVYADAGRWRVLGRMLKTQEAAEAAAQPLAERGAAVWPAAVPALVLQVTATPEQLSALQSALHALDMGCTQPEEIARRLESREMDNAEAREQTAMLKAELHSAERAFSVTGAKGRLSDALREALKQAESALEPLTKAQKETRLALAGRIRCAGIQVWFLRAGLSELK